jgi:hypothetical protein
MAINYTLKKEGNNLEVTAAGFDGSLEEVQEYGMAVLQEAIRGNVSTVLCDETQLEYRLGTLDTYTSAEFISAHAPKLARVAIVCNDKGYTDASFWETVVVNRGLTVRVFKDVLEARKWLTV